MVETAHSNRKLSARWTRVSAALLFPIGAGHFLISVQTYLAGWNQAGPGALLDALAESLVMIFVPLLLVGLIAWLWRAASSAFDWFDSWLMFLLVGLVLFPVSFVALALALQPFSGPSLGAGIGSVVIALFLAIATCLAYGLPRLFVPSLRPGCFRDAARSG